MKYRTYDNGVYRDMTPEEIKQLNNQPQPQPRSKEEILADLERLKQELQAMVEN